MRRLGIDVRKLADFGIGSYLQGLLGEFARRGEPRGFVVLVDPGGRHLLPEMPEDWQVVEVAARGYSIEEHFAVPLAAVRHGVATLHVPHYVVPAFYPGKVVVTIHDIIHVLFPQFLRRGGLAYARLMIARAVRRAQRIVTPSATTAHDLQRLFGTGAEKLLVIPHGVDPEFLQPAGPDDEAVLERLGVGPPYLLHVGNHKPHKNVEGLLKAYQILVHDGRGETPPLVLVGGFSADGVLARRAAAMGLGGRVRCLGHVERGELAALFRGALLFLYPTLYEGFGLPVLEAMACGVPVVAGDIPAVREVAGDAVERVNPRDVVALANTVRRLLDQAEHRRELAARGRARARLFSWQRAADATLSVYRAVAAEA